MGVDMTNYLVLGARFTWAEFYVGCSHCNNEDGMERAEKYQEPFDDNGHKYEVTAPGGLVVLSNEEDGGYFIIGRILVKRQTDQGFELTECRELWAEAEAEAMEVWIKHAFPFLADLDRGVGVWLFTHYH